MYATQTDAEGKVRIRFETLSRRLNKINVDILHKEPESYHLQTTLATPDAGELGCFIRDELELIKTSDSSSAFRRLYNAVAPRAQSLPELLHHQNEVVEHFVYFVNTAPTKDLASGFSLISVLGRDLDKDLYTHFHPLFSSLVDIIPKVSMSGGATPNLQVPNPELTGKLFETLSYLLKANLSKLVETPQDLSPYYGPLLGSPVAFVRDFAAKSFIIVIRKLSNKVFKDHMKKLIRAISLNIQQSFDDKDEFARFCQENLATDNSDEDSRVDDRRRGGGSDAQKRCSWILNGVSQMLFYVCRGIVGLMHSKAPPRLEALVKIILGALDHADAEKTSSNLGQMWVGGIILLNAIKGLQEHLFSEEQRVLLLAVLPLCEEKNGLQDLPDNKVQHHVDATNAFLSVKHSVLLELLSGRKSKTVRCLETSLLNRFIDVTFSVCKVHNFLHTERNMCDANATLQNRRLLRDLWVAFPTNKLVLAQVPDLIAVQSLTLLPSEGIVYFTNELFKELPHSIASSHLLPVMITCAQKLRSSPSLAPSQWLSLFYNVLASVRNVKPDVDAMRKQYINVESSYIPSFYPLDFAVSDSSTECLKAVVDLLGQQLKQFIKKSSKSKAAVSAPLDPQVIQLSARIVTWFSHVIEEQGDRASVFGDLLVMVTALVQEAVLKRKAADCVPTLYSYPEVIVMYAHLVNVEEDLDAARQVSELIKSLALHFASTAPGLGLTFALNTLIEKMVSSIEDSPQHLLSSSLLSPEECTALIRNLSFALTTPSYWLKLEILKLLSRFQPPLDEIKNRYQQAEKNAGGGNDDDDRLPEVQDVATLALECMLYPIDLGHEREIRRRLEVMEVYCRGNKLPHDFIAMAAGFCIGFLNVKFKPLWSSVLQVLVTISQTSAGEEILWRLLSQFFSRDSLSAVGEEISSTLGSATILSSQELLAGLDNVHRADDGKLSIPTWLAQSSVFWYNVSDDVVEASAVPLDGRADNDSLYGSVFQLLQKAPHVTLKRSKIVVGAFLRFLRSQYYVIYPDEPEIASLSKFGLFVPDEDTASVDDNEEQVSVSMTLKQVRNRLEAFLTAFAAVQSPRQLFRHQLLYIIYGELLCKPDTAVSKQALECIVTYKQPEVAPYKDRLRKLYEDRKFRDELLALASSKDQIAEDDDNFIKEEHKPELFPLVVRILFGRLTAKAGGKRADREQTSSRRAAVLVFISNISTDYVGQLLYLMIRGIVPVEEVNRSDATRIVQFKQNVADMHVVTAELHKAYEKNIEAFMKINSETLSAVYWDKLIGFLYLLEPTISILGMGLTKHVPLLHRVLEQMLVYSHTFKASTVEIQQQDAAVNDQGEDEDAAVVEEDAEPETLPGGEEEEQAAALVTKQARISNEGKYSSNVRTMCVQRLVGMMTAFHTVFAFDQHCGLIMDTLTPLIAALPSAMLSATRAPALLLLLDQISRYPNSIGLLTRDRTIMSSIISCIAIPRMNPNVNKMILEVLERVLSVGEGAMLRPHAEELVVMFSRRFVGVQADAQTELRLSDIEIKEVQTLRLELSFLCSVGTALFADSRIAIDSLAANNLATLVLGLLRVYAFSGKRVRVNEDWIVNVLRIFKSMIWRITDASSHAGFVSRLFGPANSDSSLFNTSTVRKELTDVYQALTQHASVRDVLQPLGAVVASMTQQDENVLDSRDYGSLVPVFQALGEEQVADGALSWSQLLGPLSWQERNNARPITTHLYMSSAVVYETLRCMYDAEMFVRRSALTALKQLVVQCIQWDRAMEEAEEETVGAEDIHTGWLNLFQAILVPALRKALKQSNDNVRGGFVQLLAHLVRVCSLVPKMQGVELYHIDLLQLAHQDPDQDFFENITHIQVHRRARALAKLRAALVASVGEGEGEGGEGLVTLRVSTFVHILLPMCLYYLQSDEYQKKLHQKVLEEVGHFFGAMAAHLPWNHYYGVVKRLIQLLSKASEDKGKFIQTALCSSLDAFHFDMTTEDVKEGVVFNPDELRDNHVDVELTTKVVEGEVEIREDRGIEEEEVEVMVDDEGAETKGTEGVMEVVAESREEDASVPVVEGKSGVIRNRIAVCVVRTIIPWLKGEMIKEVKNHKGKTGEKVQTSIALAIANLIKHLEPPIVTADVRMGMFSNIVISVVNTLKNRDAKIRDVARTALAKMIHIIGLGALRPVIFELRSNLVEGYQRHISNYSVRSLLASILEDYTPPQDAPFVDVEQLDDAQFQASFVPVVPPFDAALPYIMQAVQEDLSEEVREEREVDGVIRSTMREQKGSKYTEILEITGRCILFRPTYALLRPDRPEAVSSIHAIVGPLLSGLQVAQTTLVYSRLAEALSRLAAGLAKNNSVQDKELLLYLHSTLQPFVGMMVGEHRRYKKKMGRVVKPAIAASAEEDLSDMESGLPSYLVDDADADGEEELTLIRDHRDAPKKPKNADKHDLSQQAPKQWLPTEWTALKGQKAVIEERNRTQKEQFKVLDGANAPKLTGRNRYDKLMLSKGNHNASTSGISRSTLLAIKFCLTLFQSSLRKGVLRAKDTEIQSMVVPFMPLLKSFLYITGASDVLVLAIKCIGALVVWGVELTGGMAGEIAAKVLKIMVRHGATVTTENELCQACVQVLVALFRRHNEDKARTDLRFPLSEPELRSLVEMLTLSITAITSSFQTASFQLIKEIIRARVLLPEIYDLVVKLTEQIVLSHRKGIRDASSSITIQFILSYPLTKARAESHFKQLINNCDYEYEEGRLAAVTTLLSVIRALPVPVLQENAQMMFLSLTLKLVNEVSSQCRDAVVNVLSVLVQRGGEEYAKLFQDYAFKWLQALTKHTDSCVVPVQAVTLVRIGAQALAIIYKSVPEAAKSGTVTIKEVLALVYTHLVYFLTCEDAAVARQEVSKLVWNAIYHLVLLTEQLYACSAQAADHAVTHLDCEQLRPAAWRNMRSTAPQVFERYRAAHFMDLVAELMLYPHPWVRSSAARVLLQYCQLRQEKKKPRLALYKDGYELLAQPNAFYQLARKVCVLLNQQSLPHSLEQTAASMATCLVGLMMQYGELDVYQDGGEDADAQQLPTSFNPETGEYRDGGADDEQPLRPEEEEGAVEEVENIIYTIDHVDELVAAAPCDEIVSEDDEQNATPRNRKRGVSGAAAVSLSAEKKLKPAVPATLVGQDDEQAPTGAGQQRGLTWVMNRLRAIGADIRGKRRQHVLRVFLDLIRSVDRLDGLRKHLSLLVEVPVRVVMAAGSASRLLDDAKALQADQEMRGLAQDILDGLEQRLGASAFMQLFAEAQMRVQGLKAERKRQMRVEAVADPRAFARRKVERANQKKDAKKRKANKFVALKGAKRPRQAAEL